MSYKIIILYIISESSIHIIENDGRLIKYVEWVSIIGVSTLYFYIVQFYSFTRRIYYIVIFIICPVFTKGVYKTALI